MEIIIQLIGVLGIIASIIVITASMESKIIVVVIFGFLKTFIFILQNKSHMTCLLTSHMATYPIEF